MSNAKNPPPSLQRGQNLPLSEKLAWSLTETAEATGLSVRTIQLAVEAGELAATHIGRRVLLLPDRVNAWLISRESGGR